MSTQALKHSSIALSLIFSSLLLTLFGCSSGSISDPSLISSVQYQNDPNNCGSAGIVCPGTQPGCCNGTCRDLSNDSKNCGLCEKQCSGGQQCAPSKQGMGFCMAFFNESLKDSIVSGECSTYCGCYCPNGKPVITCDFYFEGYHCNESCLSLGCSQTAGIGAPPGGQLPSCPIPSLKEYRAKVHRRNGKGNMAHQFGSLKRS